MEVFKQIRAHIEELESAQRLTVKQLDQLKKDLTKDIDLVRKSVTLSHAATTALAGTFASIEQMLREDRERITAVEARVEALERRTPAA